MSMNSKAGHIGFEDFVNSSWKPLPMELQWKATSTSQKWLRSPFEVTLRIRDLN
jgi:hypothetical protein